MQDRLETIIKEGRKRESYTILLVAPHGAYSMAAVVDPQALIDDPKIAAEYMRALVHNAHRQTRVPVRD